MIAIRAITLIWMASMTETNKYAYVVILDYCQVSSEVVGVYTELREAELVTSGGKTASGSFRIYRCEIGAPASDIWKLDCGNLMVRND